MVKVFCGRNGIALFAYYCIVYGKDCIHAIHGQDVNFFYQAFGTEKDIGVIWMFAHRSDENVIMDII